MRFRLSAGDDGVVTTASAELLRTRRGRAPQRILVVSALLVLLVVTAPVYFRVGWARMESACGANPPGAQNSFSVEFDWTWSPLGFTCTYDDGRTVTSLWH